MTEDHRNSPEAIEALAEAWASIDGKLEQFRAGKQAKTLTEEVEQHGGHYSGYTAEAEEMIRRLQARGYDVTPLPLGPPTDDL